MTKIKNTLRRYEQNENCNPCYTLTHFNNILDLELRMEPTVVASQGSKLCDHFTAMYF